MLRENPYLRLAIQKSGRLFELSCQLLRDCGINFDPYAHSLLKKAKNVPLELLFVRDDDIPELINSGVCDLGIVGGNVYYERLLSWKKTAHPLRLQTLIPLDFGHCRLSLAAPDNFSYKSSADLNDCVIATSYPAILAQFLEAERVNAEIVELSGAVEIAPRLNIADLICDLVSSGSTLQANGLQELTTIYTSEALLLRQNKTLSDKFEQFIKSLIFRIQGVHKGQQQCYLMLHCQRENLDTICRILPAQESPTLLKLQHREDLLVVHTLCPQEGIWEKIEELKSYGASSIVTLPVNQALD